ncbi:hypothetical protein HKCCSP123_19530 [Rhodobacterales bacterium HKCCSP123]|nr:hypothetical protein [Rhodobacterales bacterium HKCCSP123]
MGQTVQYAYLPEDFAGSLPRDPLGAAQTVVSLPVRLDRSARPVETRIEAERLAAPLAIGGCRFEAGDAARRLWSLVDATRGVRLTAWRLEAAEGAEEGAEEGDDAAACGPRTVIAAALPLKAGQTYDLSLELAPGSLAILRGGGLARATRILTEAGKRPIEEIAPGDRVWCEAGLFLPVLWHGVHGFPSRGPAAALRLPRGLPELNEDLVVAGSQLVRLETGGGPALAPASAFERAGLARREFGAAVTWHQLLLPEHALIRAMGLAVASVFAPDRLGR